MKLIFGMKLILVRHGETDWNVQYRVQGGKDIPLNAEGKKQAKKVGLRLRNEKIDVIYSSGMKRAMQTAQEIAKFRKIPIYRSSLIKERGFGRLEGMHRDEFRRIRDQSGLPYHLYRPPEGENYVDVSRRVRKFLTMLRKKHSSQTVAVVSHGGIIRTFIMLITKRPLANVHEIDQHNAAVNIIELRHGSPPKIHYLNSTEHL